MGSSVVYDDNVPNALAFIDKYNQVSRILNPIDQCLRRIDLHSSNDKEIRELGMLHREGWRSLMVRKWQSSYFFPRRI